MTIICGGLNNNSMAICADTRCTSDGFIHGDVKNGSKIYYSKELDTLFGHAGVSHIGKLIFRAIKEKGSCKTEITTPDDIYYFVKSIYDSLEDRHRLKPDRYDGDGCCYTSRDSHVDVIFPYTPQTIYVEMED